MKIKNTITWLAVLITVIISSVVSVSAAPIKGTLLSKSAQIAVIGEISLNDGERENITLTVYDENNKLVYVDQMITTGKYDFRVSIGDISKSYTYNVNQGGVVVNDTVKSIKANNMLNYEMKLFDMKSSQLEVIFNNPLGLTDEDIDDYVPIIAYYDEQGKLLDSKILNGGKFDFEGESITFETYPPEGTKNVKAYLWNSMVKMTPHINAEESKDRETLLFMGDSITQTNPYTAQIEHYLLTRYPNTDIKFVNAGYSGTTASNGYNMLEWNVLSEKPDIVFISYGVNDINRALYENGGTDAEKQAAIDGCVNNIERIVNVLLENDVKVILSTPFFYDDGDYGEDSPHPAIDGINEALKKVGNGVKTIGEKYNLKVVDTWKITNDVSEQTRAEKGGQMVMHWSDRVHLRPTGGYAMLYQFVKDMGLNELVASIDIDASASKIIAENATVKLLECDERKVEYTYLANAIPLATESYYKEAKDLFVGMDISDINQEIIRATGLLDGTYSICFDGVEIIKCTSDELAEGINIAELSNNPAQIKAKNVVKYVWKSKHEAMKNNGSKQSLYEKGLLNNYQAIEELDDGTEKKKYLEYIKYEKETFKNFINAEYEAEPEQYTVTIVKLED